MLLYNQMYIQPPIIVAKSKIQRKKESLLNFIKSLSFHMNSLFSFFPHIKQIWKFKVCLTVLFGRMQRNLCKWWSGTTVLTRMKQYLDHLYRVRSWGTHFRVQCYWARWDAQGWWRLNRVLVRRWGWMWCGILSWFGGESYQSLHPVTHLELRAITRDTYQEVQM